MNKTILHLGSGMKYDPACVNVDLVASVKPDVVHDLDAMPWPFEENTFTEVRAFDVLEHLDDIVAAMEEIHRVSKADADVFITVPHYSSANAWTDITHRHYFSVNSFNYFTGDHRFNFYTDRRFQRVASGIVFHPTLANKIVHRLAARFPDEYERRWAWMFPAWFLSFHLRVIKSSKEAT